MFTSRWDLESVVKISLNNSKQKKKIKKGKKRKAEKQYTEKLLVIQWAPVTHLSYF